MSRRLIAITVLVLGAALLGCGGSDSATTTGARATTVSDPHGRISAKSGESIILSFAAEPGVGFSWTLSANRPQGVLVKTGERFVADTPGTVGGPAAQQFRFRATHAGAAHLTFRHEYRGKLRGTRAVTVGVG